jgi:hypothetical protein
MPGASRSRRLADVPRAKDSILPNDATRSADRAELPLPASTEWWISPEAVRRLIGAWAYGALSETDRPGSAEVRRAVGVGCAIAEIAFEAQRTPFAARAGQAGGTEARRLWEIEVEADAGRLSELAGYSTREAVSAIELLLQSGALQQLDLSPTTRAGGASSRRVRLAEGACETAPAVARIEWASVREALREAGVAASAIAAPLAVLREIGRASGPVADPMAAPHVRYSVRELEAATLFSRSTVSEALAALERAELVATEARRGHTLRCALAPRAFGIVSDSAAPSPLVADPLPTADESTGISEPRPATTQPPEPTTPVPQPSKGIVHLGEFAGTPIFGPAGTPVVVECDEQGQWTCRVGPHLRLGPA